MMCSGVRSSRRIAGWAVLAILLGLCLVPAPNAAAEPDGSVLKVFLRLEKGHFAVDRGLSDFTASSDFQQLSSAPAATVETRLYDDLDRVLSGLSKVYRLALKNQERKLDDEGKLDPQTRSVRTLSSSSWQAATGVFNRWAGTEADCQPPVSKRTCLQLVLLKSLSAPEFPLAVQARRRSALMLQVSSPDHPTDIMTGMIQFLVADPVPAGEDAFAIRYRNHATAETAIFPPREIRKTLGELAGELWRAADVDRQVTALYAGVGMGADVTVSAAGRQREIEITESARIGRILVPRPAAGANSDAAKILYLLLEHRAFRQLVAKGAVGATLAATPEIEGFPDHWAFDYVATLGWADGTQPYFDQQQLAAQVQALAAIGFSLSDIPAAGRPGAGAGDSFVDLVIQKIVAKKDSAGEDAAEPAGEDAADPAGEDAAEPAGEDAADPAGEDAADPAGEAQAGAGDPADRPPAVTQLLDMAGRAGEKNFIGGSAEWRPEQGVRLAAVYRRRGLGSQSGVLTVTAGGFGGDGLGEVKFGTDFVAVRKLKRRLSIQLDTGVDQQADRLFAQNELNERRRGATLRAELELFRDLRGQGLRLAADLRAVEVQLSDDADDGAVVTRQDLTLLKLGLTYLRDARLRRYPWNLELAPVLEVGLGLARDEPRFETFKLEGGYHRLLPRRAELDLRAHFGAASDRTPIFEQPSLGGAESLRGFRADAAIGCLTWSLQNEIWLPVTRAGAGAGRLMRMLSQLRLAIFVDAGGVERSSEAPDGTRAGAGAGLRMDLGAAVMALDWGYGFETPVAEERESKIYFSFRRKLHF